MYTFPIEFPIDSLSVDNKCIFRANGSAYRLVSKIPLNEDDFLSTRMQYPQRKYNCIEQEFRSYGISFWRNLDRVKQVQINYPSTNQLGGDKIVSVDFNPSLGVIKEDRNTHLTLWKQQNEYVSQCSFVEVK